MNYGLYEMILTEFVMICICSHNGKFSYGYASSAGKRSSMEDFYETRIDGVDGETVGLFGVFDGIVAYFSNFCLLIVFSSENMPKIFHKEIMPWIFYQYSLLICFFPKFFNFLQYWKINCLM
jgi:hypothetical protein